MGKFVVPIQIRWSDIDQNRHLRHSAYYDYGATVRMKFLNEGGLTTEKMEELQVGPILFREEALFKREITLEDKITVDVEICSAREDYSRWSLRHNFLKADGTVAAIINMDGAFLDLTKRKLTQPPDFVKEIFRSFQKSSDFTFGRG
ncbi:MAG TPA: acyl-CoA thioesterase [Cyclobacteriaceae bacterium]|nr:thioesterase family protein [Cyclobacteriaceae bacterium]MCB9238083.1 thioesterase family protein [Flammeovirgaceae bacterium]MCB0499503.1 thioesterase family protein [Cyclobacteriaceae bacterium]MCO5272525.1 thioesterase family protein [Cyclobacteriaceae bacterium]MCW5901593.1 thioesterase family protein [Cyclobacteriaceae bacterium]